MTTMQIGALNADIQRSLGAIADDETMLKRVAKYLRRVVKQKEEDPTLMSKEEFLQHVDESMNQARQGKTHRINSVEELDNFLNSL